MSTKSTKYELVRKYEKEQVLKYECREFLPVMKLVKGTHAFFYTLDVIMNRMRWLVIFPLVFLFSCSGNKKELKVSEKDIEGYWVSGYLLHNTELSRSLAAESGKEPGIEILRLVNEVNGYRDTSFQLKGDILTYRIKAGYHDLQQAGYDEIAFKRDKEIFRDFRIIFLSKERLVLFDKITGKETTFYNLAILPQEKQSVRSITAKNTRMNFNHEHPDSAYIGLRNWFQNKFFLHPIKTDDKWVARISTLAGAINWKNALAIQEAHSIKADVSKGENHSLIMVRYLPGPPFQLKTDKHFGLWNVSSLTNDPALNALQLEMDAWAFYCYNHGILQQISIGCSYGFPKPDYINWECTDEYLK